VDRVLQSAALTCTLLGLLSAAAVLSRRAQVRLALGVLLDFLLGAGLLRLAAHPSGGALTSAALIVIVRKLITFGLSTPGPGHGQPPPKVRSQTGRRSPLPRRPE